MKMSAHELHFLLSDGFLFNLNYFFPRCLKQKIKILEYYIFKLNDCFVALIFSESYMDGSEKTETITLSFARLFYQKKLFHISGLF